MSPHTKVNGEQDAAKKSLSFETKQIGRGIPPDRKPQAMLKEGHKHLPGLDEAVVRNIDACEQLSYIDIVALTVPSFPRWGSEEEDLESGAWLIRAWKGANRSISPSTLLALFPRFSRSLVCTGAKSEHQSKLAARKMQYVQHCGLLIVDCFSQYEPELFPGLIYRMKQPKIVLLIFVSGKIVITGAKVNLCTDILHNLIIESVNI
ncbi:hypothetical protein BHE74_00028288 [Ensete ventricosum]|nr:hypothetical protein BHE74_00028288 [Ensete ventricosum]